MKTTLSLDRFEGDKKSIAVLIADEDATPINLPRAMLPRGAKPGDMISVTLEVDHSATAKLAADTRSVQVDLKATDPGGDVTL